MNLFERTLNELDKVDNWEPDFNKSLVSIRRNWGPTANFGDATPAYGWVTVKYEKDELRIFKEFEFTKETEEEIWEEANEYWCDVSIDNNLMVNMHCQLEVNGRDYVFVTLLTGPKNNIYRNDSIALIDDTETSIKLLNDHRWMLDAATGMMMCNFKSKKVYYHCRLLGVKDGVDPNMVVHKDSNKLNNTRNNLVVITKEMIAKYSEKKKINENIEKTASKSECLICCSKLKGNNVWRCVHCGMGICCVDMKFIMKIKLDKYNCSCCLMNITCPHCEGKSSLDHTGLTDLDLIKIHADIYLKMIKLNSE